MRRPSSVARRVHFLPALCALVPALAWSGIWSPATLGAQPPDSSPAAAASQHARPRPVLPRFVAAGADTIRLGDPRARVAMYAEFATDTMVRLPLLAAEEADGVLFYLAPDGGPIRRIAFVYGEGRPIAAMLEQHLRDFGPPAEQSSAPVPDGLRESWTWMDTDTHMTFTKFTPEQNAVGAIMVVTDLRRVAAPARSPFSDGLLVTNPAAWTLLANCPVTDAPHAPSRRPACDVAAREHAVTRARFARFERYAP